MFFLRFIGRYGNIIHCLLADRDLGLGQHFVEEAIAVRHLSQPLAKPLERDIIVMNKIPE